MFNHDEQRLPEWLGRYYGVDVLGIWIRCMDDMSSSKGMDVKRKRRLKPGTLRTDHNW